MPTAPPRGRRSLVATLAVSLLGGCSVFQTVGFAPDEVDETAVREAPGRGEPAHVEVQHVLVAFEGTGVRNVTRTKEEAERLAGRVHAMALEGRDFEELIRLCSDDRRGMGTLLISNFAVPSGPDEIERRLLDRGFTRAAFSLEPGQVVLVPWHETDTPKGWHVIRRVR